jgi:succinate dehydrogenase/fumarate reductase flavoprotein subunit
MPLPYSSSSRPPGANVKVVQRLLGHKTAVLTLDRYGHLFPDDLDAVADAFEAAAAAHTTADWLRTGRPLKPVVTGTNAV